MVICWKCAEEHADPSGAFCTKQVTAEVRAARLAKRNDGGGADNVRDGGANGDVNDDDGRDKAPAVDMDDEEIQLMVELAAQEAKGRKLRLKQRIDRLARQNAELEAAKDIPNGGPGIQGQGQPPQQLQIPPSPLPLQEKDSKFSIARFLPRLENVRKANFQELMFGSLEWAIHANVDGELKGYLQHLSYMCLMSATGIYPPEASVEYDLGVRELADSRGMPAFGPGDYNLTMRHYGLIGTYEGRRLAQGPATTPSASKKKAASSSHPKRGQRTCHRTRECLYIVEL